MEAGSRTHTNKATDNPRNRNPDLENRSGTQDRQNPFEDIQG